jgi:hypothetical protein
MVNRQALHGSFANTSPQRRVTVNFGFHRYTSVIDQVGKLSGAGNRYDADYIRRRCRTIPLAIDARSQRFPDEVLYRYQPFADADDRPRYDERNRRGILDDYNVYDLGI